MKAYIELQRLALERGDLLSAAWMRVEKARLDWSRRRDDVSRQKVDRAMHALHYEMEAARVVASCSCGSTYTTGSFAALQVPAAGGLREVQAVAGQRSASMVAMRVCQCGEELSLVMRDSP